jgi:hypothetical protein
MMKTRFTLTCFAALGAVFAQAQFIEGSRGAGVASSASMTDDARFRYAVARYARGTVEFVDGEFHFVARTAEGLVTVTGRPSRLAVDADTKVAEFGGRAVAVFSTPFGFRRVEGQFMARVQDRRVNGVGDPDTFQVAFASVGNAPFVYRGLVTAGDLLVVPRS